MTKGKKISLWILGIIVLIIIISAASGNTKSNTGNAGATTPSSAAPQSFTGTGTENIGTVNVSTESTLHWSCPTCGTDNFIIGNNINDDNTINVNSLNQTSGQTVVDAGKYTDVSIDTEGQQWTITITPNQ